MKDILNYGPKKYKYFMKYDQYLLANNYCILIKNQNK